MDGISVAANIIAVLQITGEVIKYLNDVEHAPEECRLCMTEASNLQGLLINLLYHVNQGKAGGPWFTAVRALNVENRPLDQYKQALTEPLSRVERKEATQMVKRRLLWKLRLRSLKHPGKAGTTKESREYCARDGSFVGFKNRITSDTNPFASKRYPKPSEMTEHRARDQLPVLQSNTIAIKADDMQPAVEPRRSKTTLLPLEMLQIRSGASHHAMALTDRLPYPAA